MKTAVAIVLAVIVLLGGIVVAGVVGMLIRGEPQAPAQQKPVTPLVYCHSQGGEVIKGECVPRKRAAK